MGRWMAVAMAGVALLVGPAAPTSAQEEAIGPARTAAQAWLALLDAYEFDESWRTAGKILKGAVSQKEFATTLSSTLGPFGAVSSRNPRSSEFKRTLPSAPDGEYVILEFDTAFEKKAKAVETVVLSKEPDGVWRVSGYYIR